MDNDDSTQPEMYHISFPTFSVKNPRVWFHQIEAVFHSRRISDERTMYAYVVQSLPTDVAEEVFDILENTPKTDPFTALKTALISRTSRSETAMLRELLGNLDIGDRTPSQLLRHMRTLLGSRQLDETILKQLWMDKLPHAVSSILAINHQASSESLAEMADKIAETFSKSTINQTTRDNLSEHTDQVVMRLERLEARLDGFKTRRRRSRTRSISRSKASPNSWCWYHQNYQARAKKCNQPCAFKREESLNSKAGQC